MVGWMKSSEKSTEKKKRVKGKKEEKGRKENYGKNLDKYYFWWIEKSYFLRMQSFFLHP